MDLFSVCLGFRGCGDEGLVPHALFMNAYQFGASAQITFKAQRVVHLRNQKGICEGRLIAVTMAARFGVTREQDLQRGEAEKVA